MSTAAWIAVAVVALWVAATVVVLALCTMAARGDAQTYERED